MKTVELEIRRASPSDANEIAAAHRHSIRSIGALYYPATIVNDWGARVEGDLYVNATVDALRSAVSRKGPEVPQYLS